MPNFKPRSEKVIRVDKKKTQTLDFVHREKMKEYRAHQKELPGLQRKRDRLREKIQALRDRVEAGGGGGGGGGGAVAPAAKRGRARGKGKGKGKGKRGAAATEEPADPRQELNRAVRELRELQGTIRRYKTEYKKYQLENAAHVFDYFGSKKDECKESSNRVVLNGFFAGKRDKQIKHDAAEQTSIKKYMRNIDSTNYDMDDFRVSANRCRECDGEMIPVESDGMMVCKSCHCQKPFLIDQEKTSFKEPPKEISFFAYKRINHFREILAQFQAKESTKIDPKVIEDIRAQVKKQRIQLSDLTNAKTKSILKMLGYNKYYEHIPFIKEKLGIKPPNMPVWLEQRLCNLFIEIQKPYAKYCPADRVNFLNYYYVLYKLCELLEQDKYLEHFYLLKDQTKRMEQDAIWKKICAELKWEFIPTP
jgi:hypothetical protein